jgi:hypothetical protein
MYAGNISRILSEIKPTDIVLDIGGWAQPFRRANYVLDLMPYDTRGWYTNLGRPASLGDGPEFFGRETWIQRDLCEKTPYPFDDKSVDYVICSHTLEDVRDPLWVCAEIIRIGKRGYIEVPSRLSESIANPSDGTVGAPHHRWLVTIDSGKILFEMKYDLIHKKGLHFPPYVAEWVSLEQHLQWMFWQDSFEYREATIPLGTDEIERRLQTFVRQHPYSIPVWQRIWYYARLKLRGPLTGKIPRVLKNFLNRGTTGRRLRLGRHQ